MMSLLILSLLLACCGDLTPSKIPSTVKPTFSASEEASMLRQQFKLFKENECPNAVNASKDLPKEVQQALQVKVFIQTTDDALNKNFTFPVDMGKAGIVIFEGQRYITTANHVLKASVELIHSSRNSKPEVFGKAFFVLSFEMGGEYFSIPLDDTDVLNAKNQQFGWLRPLHSTNSFDEIILQKVPANVFSSAQGIIIPSKADFDTIINKKGICDKSVEIYGVTLENDIVPVGFNGAVGKGFYYNQIYITFEQDLAFRSLTSQSLGQGSSGSLVIAKLPGGSIVALGICSGAIASDAISKVSDLAYTFKNQPTMYLTFSRLYQ